MFKVEFIGRKLANYEPILSGVQFGFIGKPLYFRVTAEQAPISLEIEFVVDRSSEKKALELEISPGPDGSGKLTFWNPTEGASSGLKQAVSLIQAPPNHLLGIIFIVDHLRGSDSYRLTYEFSNGLLLPIPEGGAK